MCGICGIVGTERGTAVQPHALLAMRESLAHRGPDDAGSYVSSSAALASRRLAILDLSRHGHMPMGTPDGRYWITYNGEVYNFRELREELRLRGHRFRSNGDTEVLLYLYRDEGPGMLDRLNGMFAFAIWDSMNKALFLARDRLGVKPLYYALYKNKLYFASEAKALFAAGVPAEFDHRTWGELLCFRYLAGDATPFVGVQRLLAGHHLTWHDGRLTIRRWWNLGEKVKALRSRLPRDPVKWFAEVFDDAVRIRRISDVPIGVLLSGGLDSSSVAASLAADAGPGVSSFTVRFDDPNYDEGPLAQLVASRWGLTRAS